MAARSDPAARAGSRDERAGAVVPDGNFAGRPPGNLAGILSCRRFGKTRESGAGRKRFGITAGGDSKPWSDPFGRFRQGAARNLQPGNRSRGQSGSIERLFPAGERESAGSHRAKRKRSGAQEDRRIQIVADAFQGRHRLPDGTAAKVGGETMQEERSVSALRKTLRLPIILAALGSCSGQLAKGGAPARSGQASSAAAQATEAPRIENAKLETSAVGPSLDATLLEITATPKKPHWVAYHVD